MPGQWWSNAGDWVAGRRASKHEEMATKPEKRLKHPEDLDLYSHRTDNSSRILDALNDRDDVSDHEDPDDGPEPVCAPG